MEKKNNSIPIYLIRHGEARKSWDEDKDPGLSFKGKEQALKLGRFLNEDLKNKKFKIISSPLKRAQETARPFSKERKQKITINTKFSEIPSPGVSMKDRSNWLGTIFNIDIENLEEPQNLWKNNILEEIKNTKEPTLIFSHFMVINVVLNKIFNHKKLVVFRPDNCSVTKIQVLNQKIKLIEQGQELFTIVN